MPHGTRTIRDFAVLHLRMAAHTAKVRLLRFMAPDTTALGVDRVHRVLEGHASALIAAPKGVAVGARRHALMMARAAICVGVLVHNMRERYGVDLARIEVTGSE